MRQTPQDDFYRWLVELCMCLPRVTFTARPPDPPHSDWLPSGPEMDMRPLYRAYGQLAQDEETALLWQSLTRLVQDLNGDVGGLRDITGEWAVKLQGALPDQPAAALLTEMLGGVDLGGLLTALRTGQDARAPRTSRPTAAAGVPDMPDNVVMLFPDGAPAEHPASRRSEAAEAEAAHPADVAAPATQSRPVESPPESPRAEQDRQDPPAPPATSAADAVAPVIPLPPTPVSRLRWFASGVAVMATVGAAAAVAFTLSRPSGDSASVVSARVVATEIQALPLGEHNYATCPAPAADEAPLLLAASEPAAIPAAARPIVPAQRNLSPAKLGVDFDVVIIRDRHHPEEPASVLSFSRTNEIPAGKRVVEFQPVKGVGMVIGLASEEAQIVVEVVHP